MEGVIIEVILILFYRVLYLSIVASFIGLFILIFRKVTNNKIFPKCNYILWEIFIFSLIIPISNPLNINIYKFVNVEDFLQKIERSMNVVWNLHKSENEMIYLTNNIRRNNFFHFLNLIDILIISWLIVITILLIKRIYSYLKLSKTFGKQILVDERVNKIFKKCKEKLNISRNIKLINQNILNTPAIFGVFNVRILLNEKIKDFDDETIESVFLHELSHYKRKDNVLNFVILILKSIYFFNPLISFMFKRMKNDIEIATDEMAIGKMNFSERKKYCRSIVEVACINNRKLEFVLGLSNNKKIIEERIEMISLKNQMEKYSKLILTVTVSAILFMWIFLYPTVYGKVENSFAIKTNLSDYVEIMPISKENEIKAIDVKDASKIFIKLSDRNYNKISVYSTDELNNLENIMYIKNGNIQKLGEYLYEITFANGYKYKIKFVF